jgi:hypothetical protein
MSLGYSWKRDYVAGTVISFTHMEPMQELCVVKHTDTYERCKS